jgi:dephospho-CoA kinase
MIREVRPLTVEEATSRDIVEIEDTNKGGPIAMANFFIINGSSMEDLKKQTERVIGALK